MTDEELFSIVGIQQEEEVSLTIKKAKPPLVSIVLLGIIVIGCLFANIVSRKDPAYLDLLNYTKAPNQEFWFGTDTLGRDIFSCIWHGGRISLFIGFLSAAISAIIAVIYGSVSGMAPKWLDRWMMRLTEIFLSIPTLLITVFLQAVIGRADVFSLAFIIGLTNWCSIAKIIRTQVKQIRSTDFVVASKSIGAGFFYILKRHLLPNFISSVMFMLVMNIRTGIIAESTLSFIGIGLPIDVISWGSMLSLAERALLSGAWWMIVIPGAFLVTLLVCVTNIGNWIGKNMDQRENNL